MNCKVGLWIGLCAISDKRKKLKIETLIDVHASWLFLQNILGATERTRRIPLHQYPSLSADLPATTWNPSVRMSWKVNWKAPTVHKLMEFKIYLFIFPPFPLFPSFSFFFCSLSSNCGLQSLPRSRQGVDQRRWVKWITIYGNLLYCGLLLPELS